VAAALAGRRFVYEGAIRNTDRTTGTITGAEIVRRSGGAVIADDTVTLRLKGSAGQSLGAFLPAGVTIELDGDANDYVAKGLSGGRVIVRAPETAGFDAATSIIAGNVVAYGATGGELFLNGVVGERLGVRNSGATIIVEGTGDHACEYMTGGTVIVLGPVGRNVAAGMSGGTAYLYDPDEDLNSKLAAGTFEVEMLDFDDDELVRGLMERYVAATGSELARQLLDAWPTTRMSFVRVRAGEYVAALERMSRG